MVKCQAKKNSTYIQHQARQGSNLSCFGPSQAFSTLGLPYFPHKSILFEGSHYFLIVAKTERRERETETRSKSSEGKGKTGSKTEERARTTGKTSRKREERKRKIGKETKRRKGKTGKEREEGRRTKEKRGRSSVSIHTGCFFLMIK